MPNIPENIIQLDNIKKVFQTDEIETHALTGVHLSIRTGEFAIISGPSGCGKSTLLSIMGLLDFPNEGTYLLNGDDTATMNARKQANIRNQQIGFIFQSFNLIGNLTVFENIELPLIYRRVPVKERGARVMKTLDRLQMTHRRNHLPSQLSGGQQQRVAVARALVGDSKVLLADEPTGNLDTHNGNRIIEILQQLNAEGSTICMVTHEKRYETFGSRVVKMLDGKIVEIIENRTVEVNP
jgi:putative ABC transport system ATP-binding protein